MSTYTVGTRCQSCRRHVRTRELLEPCSHCGSEVNAYAMQKRLSERQSALKAAEDVRLIAFLAVGFVFLLIAGRVISSKERTIERVKVPEVAERIADASQRDLSH